MKTFIYSCLCCALTISVFTACHQRSAKKVSTEKPLSIAANDSTHISVKYAKGFNVQYYKDYTLLTIQDPEGKSKEVQHYALLNKNQQNASIPKGCLRISMPVSRVACMTLLQLAGFARLHEESHIVGIPSTHELFNPTLQQQLKAGKTCHMGIDGNFDSEKILALAPQIILVSPMKRGGYDALKSLEIPLISYWGYKEPSPLGQAEWIKFIGLLLGDETKANKVFNNIETQYTSLRKLASQQSKQPTVMSGQLHSGNWFVAGGNSYMANIIKDAGGRYFLDDNKDTGGFNMDFETVYQKGAKTDFWRIAAGHGGTFSYKELKAEDSRYADFKAFKKKRVIYCNSRHTPFMENSPAEPEVVLSDFIKALHPDLLPNYQPVYYQLLK